LASDDPDAMTRAGQQTQALTLSYIRIYDRVDKQVNGFNKISIIVDMENFVIKK